MYVILINVLLAIFTKTLERPLAFLCFKFLDYLAAVVHNDLTTEVVQEARKGYYGEDK